MKIPVTSSNNLTNLEPAVVTHLILREETHMLNPTHMRDPVHLHEQPIRTLTPISLLPLLDSLFVGVLSIPTIMLTQHQAALAMLPVPEQDLKDNCRPIMPKV